MPEARTLYDKIWESHVVEQLDGGFCVLYVDRHLVHEFTSPQAFDMLRKSGAKVRHPDATLAMADHTVETGFRPLGTGGDESQILVAALRENCQAFGVPFFGMDDPRRGIVHVVGPEQGFSLPGNTIVCGDAHAATHGAFAALGYAIGISEVAHVLATQTLILERSRNMKVLIDGNLPAGCSAKDLILAIVAAIGPTGGTDYVIEFTGDAICALSMEGRMTLCNMTIETGARAGLIAPDETTFAYLKDRPMAPKGSDFEKAVAFWRTCVSDSGAQYDKEITIQADELIPYATWGTRPAEALPITARVPDPALVDDPIKNAAMQRALDYMGLSPGTAIKDIAIDRVFIGSCTNGRIEDIRAVAAIAKGRRKLDRVDAIVVPGSGLVKQQAEAEGLHRILIEAGFVWRDPACSMCIAMNQDRLKPGERCASTSNRNFEGWQGTGGRTHLVSPSTAAVAAITGYLSDARDLDE